MPDSRRPRHVKLDRVALAVAEAEHFDAREALQRPGEAGGGILSAGKQHQRGFGLDWIAHERAISIPRPRRPIGGNRPISARSAGIGAPLAA